MYIWPMNLHSKNMREKDFYDELPQSVKDDIEEGMKDIAEGRIYLHEDVMQDVKEKFGLTK